jgi:hypothetical protein
MLSGAKRSRSIWLEHNVRHDLFHYHQGHKELEAIINPPNGAADKSKIVNLSLQLGSGQALSEVEREQTRIQICRRRRPEPVEGFH